MYYIYVTYIRTRCTALHLTALHCTALHVRTCTWDPGPPARLALPSAQCPPAGKLGKPKDLDNYGKLSN